MTWRLKDSIAEDYIAKPTENKVRIANIISSNTILIQINLEHEPMNLYTNRSRLTSALGNAVPIVISTLI